MFKYFFNAFRRAKGERIIAEYVVFDEQRLAKASEKHVLTSESSIVTSVNSEMLRDFQEVTRLCKTYIADPVVFELCREIERRIAEILKSRLEIQGLDRWCFEDKPLTLRNDEADKEEP